MKSIAVRILLPETARDGQDGLVSHLRDQFTLKPGEPDSPLRVAMNLPNEYKDAVLTKLSLSAIKVDGEKVRLRYLAEFSFSAGNKGDDYFVDLSQEMDGVILGRFLELKWSKPIPKDRSVVQRAD